MRRFLVTSALLVAACASDASSGGAAPAPQPPPGGCTLSVAFGLKRTGDAFTPFPASGGGAPITLGFQGFRYVESTIRVEGTTDDTVSLGYEVSLAGRTPASQDGGVARLTPGEGGARYADTAQIFFNDDPLPQVIGKTATIVVRARAGACEARTEATLLLLAPGSCSGGASCADAGLLSPRWRCRSRWAPRAPGSERAKRRSPTSRFRLIPTRSVPASGCTRRSRTATIPTPSRSRPTRARCTSRSRATRTSRAARSRCSTRARGRRSAACAWARARRPCACTRGDASSRSRRASPTGSPSSTRRPTPW